MSIPTILLFFREFLHLPQISGARGKRSYCRRGQAASGGCHLKGISIFFVNIFLVIPRILIFPELISAEDTFIFQKKGVFAVILLLVSFQSMCLDQATSGKYFCAIVARPAFARLCRICRLILVSSFYVYFQNGFSHKGLFTPCALLCTCNLCTLSLMCLFKDLLDVTVQAH